MTHFIISLKVFVDVIFFAVKKKERNETVFYLADASIAIFPASSCYAAMTEILINYVPLLRYGSVTWGVIFDIQMHVYTYKLQRAKIPVLFTVVTMVPVTC